MNEGRIQEVWGTSFYGVPRKSADLLVADANGDGVSDLLVGVSASCKSTPTKGERG